jgi:hypothetical protein
MAKQIYSTYKPKKSEAEMLIELQDMAKKMTDKQKQQIYSQLKKVSK